MTTVQERHKTPSDAEKRRHEVASGWSRYLRLDHLTDARYIDPESQRRDSFQDGGTGDGANLYILVDDEEGTTAVKVGCGEFSPRTFQEDFSWFRTDADREPDRMDYASRISPLLEATTLYVLEQQEGYFMDADAVDRFTKDPRGYLADHTMMIVNPGDVSFNSANRRFRNRNPSYADAYGGGMVTMDPENMTAVSIGDLDESLTMAKAAQASRAVIATQREE